MTDSKMTRITEDAIAKAIAAPHVQRPTPSTYIYTLDSHDCFGPFESTIAAVKWARMNKKTSFQVLSEPPYADTVIHKPKD